MAGKTPSMALHEWCVKKHFCEKFETVSTSGPPNQPVFEVSVEIIDTGLKAMAKGNNKKQAQHNAAQAILEMINVSGSPKVAVSQGTSLASAPAALSNNPNPFSELTKEGNYVGKLQEYCAQQGLNRPEYICGGRHGEAHQPTFTMSATLGKFSSTASSRTKQQAKQEAARALYEQIKALSQASLLRAAPPTAAPIPVLPLRAAPPTAAPIPVLPLRAAPPTAAPIPVLPVPPLQEAVPSRTSLASDTLSASAALPSMPLSDLSKNNFVGKLQEYCAKYGLKLPDYSCDGKTGEAHQLTFTMSAKLGKYSSSATGRTKQQAKQNAARALYEQLIESPSSQLSLPMDDLLRDTLNQVTSLPSSQRITKLTEQDKDEIIEKYSLCAPLSSVPKTNGTLKFGAYHRSMTDLLSTVREELNTTNFSSPRETLKGLAEKLNLQVTYHEGRDINPNNETSYVYAIINTQPTTVQIGEGHSTIMAEVQAARSVLEYWQTFLGIFPVI